MKNTLKALIGLFLLPIIIYSPRLISADSQVTLHGKALVLAVLGQSMVPVIYCESHFSQYNAQGGLLISKTHDEGEAQINVPTWGKIAQRMGYNLANEQENVEFAKYILSIQGITAWKAYKSKCYYRYV